jgi:hypothetical protein
MGGFEKIVEINPLNPDYVMFGVSGYNGPFDISDFPVKDEEYVPHYLGEMRSAEYGPRDDGNNYTYPKDIVPYRIYVGVKGKLEDGSDAPEDDFLARNGLKYGQMYGFAIDMRNTTDAVGPTAGVWRDEWHKSAYNGQMVPGKWIAQPWRWDGEGTCESGVIGNVLIYAIKYSCVSNDPFFAAISVKNFEHDGSWDYQNSPPGTEEGSDLEGYFWWTSNGIDEGGCKTEHLAAVSSCCSGCRVRDVQVFHRSSHVVLFYFISLNQDPRAEKTALILGSTCGYIGHAYVENVADTLSAAAGGLPSVFDGTYFVYRKSNISNRSRWEFKVVSCSRGFSF